MSKSSYINELVGFYTLIWQGKLKILYSILFFSSLAYLYISIVDEEYETYFDYDYNISVPDNTFKSGEVFVRLLSNEDVFQKWKDDNPNSKIEYSDISPTLTINGFIYRVNENDVELNPVERLIDGGRFSARIRTGSILIRSGDHQKLSDYYHYLQFVNKETTNTAILRIKNRKSQIIEALKVRAEAGSGTNGDTLTVEMVRVNAFLEETKKENLLDISRPTKPKKISPRVFAISFLAIFLGFIIGIISILSQIFLNRIKSLV